VTLWGADGAFVYNAHTCRAQCVNVALLSVFADLPALRVLTGLAGHSGTFGVPPRARNHDDGLPQI
jgi:hypothetical protein